MLEVRRMIASYLISMFVQRLPNNAPLAAKLYTSRVKNRDLKNFCSDVAGAETSEEARQTGLWKYCGFVAEFGSVREFNSLYWLMMVRWGELVNGKEEKNWYGPNVPKCVSFEFLLIYHFSVIGLCEGCLSQILDLGRGSICIFIFGFVIYEISLCMFSNFSVSGLWVHCAFQFYSAFDFQNSLLFYF